MNYLKHIPNHPYTYQIRFFLTPNLILFLLLSFGLSQSKVSIQDKEIEINENEAVMEVLGMVCSMCAFGIGEGFSKTDFIDKSKFLDGVSVDIDAQ